MMLSVAGQAERHYLAEAAGDKGNGSYPDFVGTLSPTKLGEVDRALVAALDVEFERL